MVFKYRKYLSGHRPNHLQKLLSATCIPTHYMAIGECGVDKHADYAIIGSKVSLIYFYYTFI